MSDPCYNRVVVTAKLDDLLFQTCNGERISQLQEIFGGNNVFHNIVPEPSIFDPRAETLSKEQLQWRLSNWGVKWDLFEGDVKISRKSKQGFTAKFVTPNRPSVNICTAIRSQGLRVSWFYDCPDTEQAGYL